jgi:hypothetical protein
VRQLTCHRCGSAGLVLHETRYEHAEFDGGLVINEEGRIEARGAAYYQPGEIQPGLTRIECASCGHDWHPRRQFAGPGR